MGLLGSLLGGMSMKDPVEGTAQIVSCTGYHGEGVMQNCRMQLVVEAEGIEPTAVEHNELVHNRKWPHPGRRGGERAPPRASAAWAGLR
jgi:hypothetical protein